MWFLFPLGNFSINCKRKTLPAGSKIPISVGDLEGFRVGISVSTQQIIKPSIDLYLFLPHLKKQFFFKYQQPMLYHSYISKL